MNEPRERKGDAKKERLFGAEATFAVRFERGLNRVTHPTLPYFPLGRRWPCAPGKPLVLIGAPSPYASSN